MILRLELKLHRRCVFCEGNIPEDRSLWCVTKDNARDFLRVYVQLGAMCPVCGRAVAGGIDREDWVKKCFWWLIHNGYFELEEG